MGGRFKSEWVAGMRRNTQYLPFWKISATAKGIDINSFADFIRVTSQPIVIRREWEDQDMSFWNPAFKIRPKVFLQVSRQITVSQEHFQTENEIPKKNLHPVTLPQSEAAQAMKLTLAASAVNKKKVIPLLPGVSFDIKGSTLVYPPFTDTGHEMVQQNIGISINKKSLEFGRHL